MAQGMNEGYLHWSHLDVMSEVDGNWSVAKGLAMDSASRSRGHMLPIS